MDDTHKAVWVEDVGMVNSELLEPAVPTPEPVQPTPTKTKKNEEVTTDGGS